MGKQPIERKRKTYCDDKGWEEEKHFFIRY